jgi:6-hydroxymethylpterin diphosphokinase MptE-like protein
MSANPIAAARVRTVTGAVPCVAIRTVDGRWVTLHSTRDPRAEAKAQLDRHARPPSGSLPRALIVIGAGLGYIVDELLERDDDARVVVLEPEPAFAARLVGRPAEAGHHVARVCVLSGPDYAGAADAWKLLDAADPNPPVLVHPVMARAWPSDIEHAKTVADRIVFSARANADAQRANAGRYLLNTLRNLQAIAEGGDVDALAGLFPDRPAVVAAAGPSLTRNLGDLRAVRDRVLLIAVDTAARPLLTAGIAPDFVVGLDPTEDNARHFVDLPDASASFLVGEGSLGVDARAAFAGRSFTFQVGGHEPWPWLASLGRDCGRLRAWGSVVTSAFDLAVRTGAPEIGFVGLDLAYTDRRPYCRDMTWESEWATLAAWGYSLDDVWEEAIDRWKGHTAADVHGREVITAPHLVAFRDWLVEQMATSPAAQKGPRYVNATGGGILAGGHLEQSTLARAFAGWSARDAEQRTQRIADAHRRSAGVRACSNVAGDGSPKGLRYDYDSCTRDRWRAFTFDTVTNVQIRDAIVVGANPRVGPQADTRVCPHVRLGVIRPAETAAVIRALLGGGAVPDWVMRDGEWSAPTADEAELWIGRAQELLHGIKSSRDALLRSDVDVTQLRGAIDVGYLGVPASALFPWASDIAPIVRAFEAALVSAIDVTRPVSPGQFPDRRDDMVRRVRKNSPYNFNELAQVACEWELSRATERV